MQELINYYEKGYIVTSLPEIIQTQLWNEIYSTDWEVDVDKVYKEKPVWYTAKKDLIQNRNIQNILERNYGNEIREKVPNSLINIAQDLIQSQQFDFIRQYKDTASVKYLHLWNGAEDIPYHIDTIDGSDTLVFVYLTDCMNWKKEYGGSISFCKEIDDTVLYEQTVYPNNGTMVIVNNSNPLIKHKVERLKELTVNRYTFSFCYTWE